MKEEKPKENPNSYMRYATMGTQMAATIGLGVFGGVQLDKWFQWKFPVCTVVLSLLSVFAAIYLAVKDLLKKK